MYQLINSILLEFLHSFKRLKTWRWFVVFVIGFMLRSNRRGVTSTIEALRLRPSLYHTALHFFRSDGYKVDMLYEKWIDIAMMYAPVHRIGERVLLLGDHIKICKEGRRMPDIQIIHQESQNAGKGEYIEGHNYGQVSAVITKGKASRSLPLITELQTAPPKQEGSKKPKSDTLVVQMVKLAKKVAKSIDAPTVIALDAYFSKGAAFITADTTEDGEKPIAIVTRGRINTVGYKTPEPPKEKRRGRPRIYGDKVVLNVLFSDMSKFKEVSMLLYGKPTKVKYMVIDLLWKPVKKQIRFVLLESVLGRCILLSSDISLSAEEIITIYALRFKIEASFDEQKNDVGSFAYHFWTKEMPKRKRWKKNNEAPEVEKNAKIESVRKATSSFVCLSTIATGIMMILAFSHGNEIWQRYPGWMRTIRSSIPTVAIVRETLAADFHDLLHHPSARRLSGFNFIQSLQRKCDFCFEDFLVDAV